MTKYLWWICPSKWKIILSFIPWLFGNYSEESRLVFLFREVDLIVEVAHPCITEEFGERFLEHADYMVLDDFETPNSSFPSLHFTLSMINRFAIIIFYRLGHQPLLQMRQFERRYLQKQAVIPKAMVYMFPVVHSGVHKMLGKWQIEAHWELVSVLVVIEFTLEWQIIDIFYAKGLVVTMKKIPSSFKLSGELKAKNERVTNDAVVLFSGSLLESIV